MAERSISVSKLQHIYNLHARDFGLSGNKNPRQLHKLNDAIESHLKDINTSLAMGQYRGQSAKLYYNAGSQIVVVLDEHDSVIAGFRVSAAQAAYINATGRLN